MKQTTLLVLGAVLLCTGARAGPSVPQLVVSHTNIVSMTTATSGNKVYAILNVSSPIGNWPERKPEGFTRKKPRLRFTFPEGMKKMTFWPSLWSFSGQTICVRFIGADKDSRSFMIQQWKDANR
jgi:hypothetical protein